VILAHIYEQDNVYASLYSCTYVYAFFYECMHGYTYLFTYLFGLFSIYFLFIYLFLFIVIRINCNWVVTRWLFYTYTKYEIYLCKHGFICRRIILCKGKGKSVPLQAWSGQEGSRKLRIPDFVTTAQDGGKVVSLKYRPPLPPGNAPGAHFC